MGELKSFGALSALAAAERATLIGALAATDNLNIVRERFLAEHDKDISVELVKKVSVAHKDQILAHREKLRAEGKFRLLFTCAGRATALADLYEEVKALEQSNSKKPKIDGLAITERDCARKERGDLFKTRMACLAEQRSIVETLETMHKNALSTQGQITELPNSDGSCVVEHGIDWSVVEASMNS